MTSLLVCDGAVPNFKSTHGYSSAYYVNSELPDQYEVKPFFVNPFNAPHRIHWLICPSHQVTLLNKCIMLPEYSMVLYL